MSLPEGTLRSAHKEKARDGGNRRGPSEVQLRQERALTFEAYVTG